MMDEDRPGTGVCTDDAGHGERRVDLEREERELLLIYERLESDDLRQAVFGLINALAASTGKSREAMPAQATANQNTSAQGVSGQDVAGRDPSSAEASDPVPPHHPSSEDDT